MSSSPARIQPLRQMHNSVDGMSTTSNGIASGGAMFTQMPPMNFDYNQNGLELAGFCSPQGKEFEF